jgi:hypothetical protein
MRASPSNLGILSAPALSIADPHESISNLFSFPPLGYELLSLAQTHLLRHIKKQLLRIPEAVRNVGKGLPECVPHHRGSLTRSDPRRLI